MLYGLGVPLRYEGVCDVQLNFEFYFTQLLNKTMGLFKWKNLPSTINEEFLMEQLILCGKVCFTQFNSNLYALNGSEGGEPNCYYQPTDFIIANPILGSKTVKVRNKDGSNSIEQLDGIVVALTKTDYLNDTITGGLYRLIYQTAGLLADNVSSLNISQINGRIAQLWTVDNDAEARTIEEIIRDMYEGHPYRVVTQNLLEKVGMVPAAQTGQTNTLLNLIEVHRAVLQDYFSELGIGYAGNMKRERVNEAEIGLQKGNLDISIYTMIQSLKEGIEKVNELFGTDISVELNDEVFYVGSANATLGEDKELLGGAEDSIAIEDSTEGTKVEEIEDPTLEEVKAKNEENKEDNGGDE